MCWQKCIFARFQVGNRRTLGVRDSSYVTALALQCTCAAAYVGSLCTSHIVSLLDGFLDPETDVESNLDNARSLASIFRAEGQRMRRVVID